MIRALLLPVLCCFSVFANAQNFRGQWKGYFVDKTQSAGNMGGRCDYVVDLNVKGTAVSGYSYTYFTEGAKKFYTVCRLEGYADQKTGQIGITEVARTKTNVPAYVTNSFQIHKLKWRKAGAEEILEGRWDPASGARNAGYGSTLLKKRKLNNISAAPKTAIAARDPFKRSSISALIASAKTPVTGAKPLQLASAAVARPVVNAANPTRSSDPVTVPNPPMTNANDPDRVPVIERPEMPARYANRVETLQHTIGTMRDLIYVELYDNGEIDGDSVSLYYNGNQLLCHKMLTQNAISIELPVAPGSENELVMHADNLGSIPPNTALLIVKDGNKRYELRLASDLKKSGVVKFIRQ